MISHALGYVGAGWQNGIFVQLMDWSRVVNFGLVQFVLAIPQQPKIRFLQVLVLFPQLLILFLVLFDSLSVVLIGGCLHSMRISDNFIGSFDSFTRVGVLILGHQLTVLDGEDAGS